MKPDTSSSDPQPPIDYSQPVAYDTNGRPLYAHPPTPADKPVGRASHVTVQPEAHHGHNFDPQLRTQYANEPSVVHATRPVEPMAPELSDEVRQKHEDSKRRYPYLNLSEGEFVIGMLQRHPVGLMAPVGITTFLVLATLLGLTAYPAIADAADLPGVEAVVLPALLLIALFALGGYVAIWVYLQNKFFLTNESVIQEIQVSLFSRHEQTVSLGSIEDASYRQKGLIQTLLNYGSIRLSTEGEETTYRFYYVSNPKRQVAILNNAVEAFKNGRPVTGE